MKDKYDSDARTLGAETKAAWAEKRLGRQVAVREVEVKEASRAPTVAAQREEEGRRLMERMPERARLVALTREGSGWSSEELARRLRTWLSEARPVALAIGGSHGLAPEHTRSTDPLF